MFMCEFCGSLIARKDNLVRHRQNLHGEEIGEKRGGRADNVFPCLVCESVFTNSTDLQEHRQTHTHSFTKIKSAHKGVCELFRLLLSENYEGDEEINSRLTFIFEKVTPLINMMLAEKKFFKASFVISLVFSKNDENEESRHRVTTNLRSNMRVFTLNADNEATISEMLSQILIVFDDYTQNGSGWTLVKCNFFDVEINKCKPLSGGCYVHTTEYKDSKLIIDSSTETPDDCFYTAIATYFVKDRCATDFIDKNIKRNLPTPVKICEIAKFEEENKHLDIAVNVVFKSDEDKGAIFPCYASKNLSAKHKIVLLLFYLENDISGKQELHYSNVEEPEKLFAHRSVSRNGNWYTSDSFFCFNCFSVFRRKEALTSHVEWCHAKEGVNYIVPEDGDCLTYNSHKKESKVGFIFFFDFETIQKSPEENKCGKNTVIVSEQEAFAFNLVLINREGEVKEDISYVGEDAADKFIKTLVRLDKKYMKIIRDIIPMNITKKDIKVFTESTHCHICKKELPDDDRVRDHDHLTGKFIGAAHNECNLKRTELKRLVGFAHNFSGYDSHIVMQAIAKYNKKIRIKAIPLNTEKFKSIQINNCLLLDSMAFLNDSLCNLVETLNASQCDFPIISQWMCDSEKKKLLLRKGIYPYELITDIDVLYDATELPLQDKFFSKLSNSHVSDSDYEHAKNVWKTFKCKNLKDYTLLYVKSDTYQLADIIFSFRNLIYSQFGLDMCHYLSLPHLSKDIMLKQTDISLEFMSDIDMIEFVKSNIRGGLSYVNTRYADAKKLSESKNEDVSLAYVDANNLYGSAMRFALPTGEYEWMTSEEIENFSISQISDMSDTGYILEVTMEYPESLHRDHSSFPLAPHHLDITGDMLSSYATSALHAMNRKGKYKARKLTSTFLTREKYVCHGMNLKLYLEQGLKLVKIHRAIKFEQTPFLKDFIDLCSLNRKNAITKFISNMWKLLVNSLYGKMIQNIENMMDCKFDIDEEDAMKHNTDPRLKSQLILSENLSIAFLKKKNLLMRQCWIVGFSILELSKFIMQNLMYNEIKKVYKSKVSVVLSDTDSWVLILPAKSTDEALAPLSHIMDFSNYDKNSHLYDPSRKNEPGLLKNEIPTENIKRVIALQSKTYAIKTKTKIDTKCKGVKKSVKEQIPFKAFVNCLRSINEHTVSQYTIRSKSHINQLIKTKKRAFSSFDDKRHLLCAIHSVPYGSCIIEKSVKECYYCKYPHLYG